MRLRYFFLGVVVLLIAVLSVTGFRGGKSEKSPLQIFPDMKFQPKYKAQAESRFFADGRADRLPVAGTVPVEATQGDEYKLTGKMKDHWGDGIPVLVDETLLKRGQDRYNINCAVCHGATGAGNGVISEYALKGVVANFQSDRLRQMSDGQIFYTVGYGKGLMNPYPHLSVEDRWAVVAYVRALQLSQNASAKELPEADRAKLSNLH